MFSPFATRVCCVAMSKINGAPLVSKDYGAKVRLWSIKTTLEQRKPGKDKLVAEEVRQLLSRCDT
jgi:hypothetical protein